MWYNMHLLTDITLLETATSRMIVIKTRRVDYLYSSSVISSCMGKLFYHRSLISCYVHRYIAPWWTCEAICRRVMFLELKGLSMEKPGQ